MSEAPPDPPQESGSRRSLTELLRHALNYGAVPVIHKVLVVAMLPFYTDWLLESEYGVVAISDFILVLLAELLGVQLLGGMVRHYFVHEDRRDQAAVVSSTALLVMGASWGVCSLALVYRDELAPILLARGSAEVPADHLSLLLGLTLLILPCQLTSLVGFSYLQILKRSALHSGVKLAKMFVELGLKIAMLGFLGWGLTGYFLSVLIGEVLTALFLTGWVLKTVGLRFDWRVLKPILAFTMPLLPVALFQLGLHQLDRKLLERILPVGEALTEVGIYGLGYQIGSMANAMVLAPFFTIWQPWVFAEGDLQQRGRLIGRVTTYAVLVVAVASLIAILFGYEAVQLLASKEGFRQAYRVVPWVTAGYVCWALYASAQLTFLAARRTRPLMAINFAALVANVALNLALVPSFGFTGAAVATLGTFAILAFAAMAGSRELAPVPFEYGRIALVLLAVLAGGAATIWIDENLGAPGRWHPVLVVALKAGLGLVLIGLLGRTALSAVDRRAFTDWVKTRLRALRRG